jgi:outer membrane protein assembly factor BamB
MSEFKIKDGTGDKYRARVDKKKRLHADSVTRTQEELANIEGNAFNINTGVITLTNATETPIMYLKNNDDKDLTIEAIAVGVGPSTGGSGGIPKITIIRNPTTGTTIDNTNDVDIKSNRNYGSSNQGTNIVAYKGATGETMTDGDDHIIFFQNSSGRLFASINEVLPKGTSIGVKFDPQTGNTSQDVYCAFICLLSDNNYIN